MPNFNSPEGELSDVFVSDAAFFEQFIPGRLWVCGRNFNGELGDNTTTHRSSPVQTIGAATNWTSVGSGTNTAFGIKSDGSLWTWGIGLDGVLGNNSNTHRSSPVQTVSTGTNWQQCAMGAFHAAAIKTDGTLWTWGFNQTTVNGQGALGVPFGSPSARSSPGQTTASGSNWRSVACAAVAVAAIKTDGTLWLWGTNLFGHLGDNTIIHRSSAVQTVAGGNNWKQVAGGQEQFGAIKTDGTLWMWGNATTGALGDGTQIHRSSPVQTIATGTDWRQITVGSFYVAAIKNNGTLWTWGNNSNGQLGDSTRIHRSSPIQTVSGGTNWKTVGAAAETTYTIKTDGSLWAWGRNDNGDIGLPDILTRSSPVQTQFRGTNWKQIGSHIGRTAYILTYTN